MPLKRGRGKGVVSGGIRELIHSGRPQNQAVAIAMDVAGMGKGKGRRGKKVKCVRCGEGCKC